MDEGRLEGVDARAQVQAVAPGGARTPANDVGGELGDVDRAVGQDQGPQDFVPEWSAPRQHALHRYLELIDTHVAHLSRMRSERTSAPVWALTSLVNAVLAEFAKFADAAGRAS